MELFLCIMDYFSEQYVSMANESICSAEAVIWMMSRDRTYLMEGHSEIVPVIVNLPNLFELQVSRIVLRACFVSNYFMFVSASFFL